MGGRTQRFGDLLEVEPIDPASLPQDQYQPIGQLIAGQVRDAILSGRLAPGVRIRQEALADRFNVSRIPVREALRQLESEGLVTLVPHSGATVSRLDFEEHVEVYMIREVLEPLAIGASTPLLTEEQLQELRELVQAIEESVGVPSDWLEADRRFHLATYAAAPMPRLLAMIEGFWNTTQQYRRAFLEAIDPESLDAVHAEHRLLLAALERRDSLDAELRLRSHIRRTRLTLSERRDLFA
jgi:DNA-binding GntR family transcriptional regulator